MTTGDSAPAPTPDSLVTAIPTDNSTDIKQSGNVAVSTGGSAPPPKPKLLVAADPTENFTDIEYSGNVAAITKLFQIIRNRVEEKEWEDLPRTNLPGAMLVSSKSPSYPYPLSKSLFGHSVTGIIPSKTLNSIYPLFISPAENKIHVPKYILIVRPSIEGDFTKKSPVAFSSTCEMAKPVVFAANEPSGKDSLLSHTKFKVFYESVWGESSFTALENNIDDLHIALGKLVEKATKDKKMNDSLKQDIDQRIISEKKDKEHLTNYQNDFMQTGKDITDNAATLADLKKSSMFDVGEIEFYEGFDVDETEWIIRLLKNGVQAPSQVSPDRLKDAKKVNNDFDNEFLKLSEILALQKHIDLKKMLVKLADKIKRGLDSLYEEIMLDMRLFSAYKDINGVNLCHQLIENIINIVGVKNGFKNEHKCKLNFQVLHVIQFKEDDKARLFDSIKVDGSTKTDIDEILTLST